MEYQKIITLSDNASNQRFKFRGKNWVEMMNQEGHIVLVVKLNLKQQC